MTEDEIIQDDTMCQDCGVDLDTLLWGCLCGECLDKGMVEELTDR